MFLIWLLAYLYKNSYFFKQTFKLLFLKSLLSLLTNRLWWLGQYINYRTQAGDAHTLHSPFLYKLYTETLLPQNWETPDSLKAINQLHRQLKSSTQEITVTDFGAGATLHQGNRTRTIGSMIKSGCKSPAGRALLYRLVQMAQPQVIVELGTSMGLTTAALQQAAPQADLYTFEGCPQTAAAARQHWQQLSLQNIHTTLGNIDETLQAVLNRIDRVDFAYLDANHRYEPTTRYFEQLLNKAHEQSVFVLDDIYWSKGMQQAWQQICRHPQTVTSIDLFEFGLVFFEKRHPRQHFQIRI